MVVVGQQDAEKVVDEKKQIGVERNQITGDIHAKKQ